MKRRKHPGYTPVAPGARFIMSTYLPVLFALAMSIESLRRCNSRDSGEVVYQCVYLVIAVAVLMQVFPLLQTTVFGEVRGAT